MLSARAASVRHMPHFPQTEEHGCYFAALTIAGKIAGVLIGLYGVDLIKKMQETLINRSEY